MYRVMIIDDEEIVREGMCKIVPWSSLGMEVVATAEDGVCGWEKIKEYEPHIVLLDINMPRKNGLVLAQEIKDQYPTMKIIILTGYDEFDYARTALRMGVEDYILKPITKKEMIELLTEIGQRLDKEVRQAQEERQMRSSVAKSKEVLRRQTVIGLMRNEITKDVLEKRCEEVGIPLTRKRYGVFLVEADNYMGEQVEQAYKELTLFAIENIARELVEPVEDGIVFSMAGQIGVLYFATEETYQTGYEQLMQEVRQQVEAMLGVTVTIGAGELVASIVDVYNAYRTASNAVGSRFFVGGDMIIYGTEGERVESVDVMRRMAWEKQLLDGMTNGQFAVVLDTITGELKQANFAREVVDEVWGSLVIAMLKWFLSLDCSLHEKVIRDIPIMVKIRAFKSYEEARLWIEALYEQCKQLLEEETTPNKSHKRNIVAFIEEHYQLSDLSMQMVCDAVHISPSHFSNIFKKELGVTFVQYVTEYRMKKAVQLLLHTAMKTYEIAEEVGYSDAHYFSAAFKKCYQMSPSQYKKQYEKKELVRCTESAITNTL